MIDKLLDRVYQAGTLRSIYQVLASLCCLLTVIAWIAKPAVGRPTPHDAHLAALGHTPLTIVYHLLGIFGIQRQWVSNVDAYLHASTVRWAVIGGFATFLGIVLARRLSPRTDSPSLQASTWWVCFAVTTQCAPSLLATLLPLATIAIIANPKRPNYERARDVANLMLAMTFVLLPIVALANDGYGSRD